MNDIDKQEFVAMIADEFDRRRQARRESDNRMVMIGGNDDEISREELRELKKIAGYSKMGRLVWGIFIATGMFITAVSIIWAQAKK